MGGYAIKTPSFNVEEGRGGGGGGYRLRPPSILWFGGFCSSIVVVTTSLRRATESGVCSCMSEYILNVQISDRTKGRNKHLSTNIYKLMGTLVF